MRKNVVAILLATLWIGFSEFLRNQLLFLSFWEDHYADLGLEFPASAINGMVWMIWSLVFAGVLWYLLRKFSFKEVFIVGWIIAFVLMWLVVGNLGVLPYTLLIFAIPLSMLEVWVAVYILYRVAINKKAQNEI